MRVCCYIKVHETISDSNGTGCFSNRCERDGGVAGYRRL